MREKTMKNLFNLKMLIPLVGISMPMSPGMAGTQSTQAIEQIINRYEAHLNESDAQSIMRLYGKDPVFMPQHSPAQVGRAAVKKAYDSVFANIDLNIKFTTYEIEIYGNTAWARTSSAGKTTIVSSGMKITEGNNELFVFKKEDGEWKIHRYLFSTTTPRQ